MGIKFSIYRAIQRIHEQALVVAGMTIGSLANQDPVRDPRRRLLELKRRLLCTTHPPQGLRLSKKTTTPPRYIFLRSGKKAPVPMVFGRSQHTSKPALQTLQSEQLVRLQTFFQVEVPFAEFAAKERILPYVTKAGFNFDDLNSAHHSSVFLILCFGSHGYDERIRGRWVYSYQSSLRFLYLYLVQI